MRLLLFNLATDVDDPILGFATGWIQALAQRVEFIHVMTMRTGRVDVPDNVRVYSVGKERGYSEPRRAAEFYRTLLHVLQSDRIDACFSHMMPMFTVLAGPVLHAKRVPIITWYAHPSLTRILKLAHYFSTHMVTSVAPAYPYRQNKLIVVGQGIDTNLFSPDSNGSFKTPPLILCAGRLSPVKDHPTLLKAVQLLKQQWDRPFQVVIIGGPGGPKDKAYVESLSRMVKELALTDTVRFEPPLPMADMPCWYRRCTVYVNLTPTGSGDKVALEAMSCGRPCIVANVGFRETLGEYAEPLLFRYRDPLDLAQRLEWICSLPESERVSTGGYLREQILRMHSLSSLADKLVAVFAEARACKENEMNLKATGSRPQ
jgi:glycosyltransferase involved in cell wall biosynthesis